MIRRNGRLLFRAACWAIAGIGILAAIVPGFAQGSSPMGSKDVALIPLESVPEWNSTGVYRPAADLSDIKVEVLAVLKDPRQVPLERFLYALTDRGQAIIHPLADQFRSRFPEGSGAAVAIYVRVQAPEEPGDYRVYDPFHIPPVEIQESNDWFDAPFRVLGIADPENEDLILPCLEPMTIEAGARAFEAPDTGATIQPDEYLPPLPQYAVVDQTGVAGKALGEMDFGEVREGWVLCLAPDIPLDQISVIYPGNLFRELGWWGKGYPYWTREEGLSAGAWAKFEDQAVVGWNGVVDRMPNGLLYLENKPIVYQGNVWISVGQALRYGASTLEGEFSNAADVFFIQLTFEGMEDLLGTWDHLALKDPLHLEICDGIGFQECDLRRDLTGSIRTDLNVQSDGGRITRRVYAEDSAQDSLTAWVRIGDLNGGSFFTDYSTWRVDIHTADEGHGSRHAACEPGACIPADASYFYDNGQPYDRDEGRFFQEDTDIPIIPFGQEARGFRVVDAEFISGQLLRAYGLDVSLQERDLFDPPDSKWLVVEVESTGDPGGFTLLRDAGSGWYLRPMQREAGYGTSAGYRVAGNAWDSETRAATSHVLIVGKVPNSWQMQDLLLAADTGPAWKLR